MSAASINNVIGKRFIELLSVDSTNNYAMQQVQSGNAGHGDAYFAYEQTAGRGQFNRQWLSAPKQNIMLSVVLNTGSLSFEQMFLLNMACAISVHALFNKYTTEKIKIKWPNDIYCRDRKAAGILIENVIRGKNWQFAVAGFGININQTAFSPEAKNPVSLTQVTGEKYDTTDLAKLFCDILNETLYPLYHNQPQHILSSYNALLYKQNETAAFKQGDDFFSAVVKRVDASGHLILEANGIEKAYRSGEIEWVLQEL